ncbi:hypothetical protein B0920_06225 [Massilia sp. KIM]|nr:hypothetical protein B0920_06225 [Massilia sp. KIM]
MERPPAATAVLLRVLSYRAAPPPAPLEARFDAAGGSIGRAPANLLALEDPGKYISRLHAAVTLVDGRFQLSDQGANPSLVNGQPLGAGATRALADGDRLTIGDYQLDVKLLLPPPPPAPESLETMIAPPPPSLPLAPPSSPFLAPPASQADALALAGILRDGGAPPADPYGLLPEGLAAPAPLAAPGSLSDHLPPERQAMPLAPVHLAIPEDYDPLASLLAPVPTPPPVPVPVPVPAQPAPAAPPVVAAPVAPEATPSPPAAAPAGAADAVVLRALLQGLGLPELRSQRPPEELARLVGAMLRAATGGTMSVLMARALTKRESHIDMTMIAARANNPLKFFPDPEGALAQMLGAEAPGYLGALAAIDAAFEDLKAHELAVIAGMRAALAAVVQRFDPARIEQRLAVPDRLERMLPARRKARMWDRLVELYGDLARDADEDLQRLFGEKFSVAYEEQVARMRGERA